MLLSALLVLGVIAIDGTAGAVSPESHFGRIVAEKPAVRTPHALDGYVAAFAEVGSQMIVGGNFQQIRTDTDATPINRPYIFRINKDTGALNTAFSPSLNGEVTAIVPSGDGETVFVAGGFSTVNGQTVRSLTKLNINTGQRVAGFNPPAFNGRIHDIALRNGKLYVSGRFTTVANQPHTVFAAVDANTGALDPNVKAEFSDPRRNGALSILASDISPDGTRLVAIGNFTKVNGQTRYQAAQLDLTTSPVSVNNWQTNSYGDGCSSSFQSYMRDVEISPDGKFFVIVTTGAYNSVFLCDTAARWDIDETGTNVQPAWVNYTGGDTLTAVAINDSVVYLGGHQRWANNNYVGDRVGPGAVERPGLSAVDPRSGATLSWNPGRTRGYGVYDFLVTQTGLWIGSDTDRISDYTYKGRLAYMPLAGGKTMPTEYTGTLPGGVVSLGLGASTGDQTNTRQFTGTSVQSSSTAAGTSQWRNARGAFMIDGNLYTGWSNGTLTKQTYNGSFGSQVNVPLALVPGDSASLNRFSSQDLASITGMFYDDASGRLYFTKSNENRLYYRSFSPESDIVGAHRYESATGAGGVTWSGVRTMFLAEGYLYTADTNGRLYRRTWNAAQGLPTGSAQQVSGSGVDSQNWLARDSFVVAEEGWQPPNAEPTAVASATCNGAACTLSAAGSSDPDGTIDSYTWNFGDGTSPGTGQTAQHVFAASGTYNVTLTVTDNRGATGTATIPVQVSIPNVAPQAAFSSTCDGFDCTFNGSASTDLDGTIVSYAWNFGDGTTGSGATAQHTFAQPGSYNVSLTVTDDDGATNVKTSSISVVDPNAIQTVDYVGVSEVNVNSTQAAVPIPAIPNNSTLLLFATVNNLEANVSGPAGWTLVDSRADNTATSQTFLWTRTANASNSNTNAVISIAGGGKVAAQMTAYSGAEGIAAHAVNIDTVSSNVRTTPAVNVTMPGSRVVQYWADKSSDNTGWNVPAGVNLRNQSVGSASGRIVAAVADVGPAAPGGAGSMSATSQGAANRRGVTWSVVLSPAGEAPNVAPAASFTSACSGLTCTFNGSASSDSDGTIQSYAWDFGDGTTESGATVEHTFSAAGSYTVGLVVTDDDGATGNSSRAVNVAEVSNAATFRGSTQFDGNTINATVGIPASVQPGDVLVLIATVNNAAAATTAPAGWTPLGGQSHAGADIQSYAFTRKAVAGDAGGSVSVPTSTYSKVSLQLLAYSSASSVSAASVAFDTVTRTERTTPVVQVAQAGSALVSYWAEKSAATSWALPAGVQLRGQTVGSGGGMVVTAAAETGSLSTGNAGGLTAVANSAGKRAAVWSIVVAPA